MDKLRNMMSPGHNEDDQKLYGAEGSSANPNTTGTGAHSSNLPGTGHSSGVNPTSGTTGGVGGTSHMPGGFDDPRDEPTPHLGNQPSTTTSSHPSTMGGIGSTTGPTSGTHHGAPQIPAQDFNSSGGPLHSSGAGTHHSGTGLSSGSGMPTGTSTRNPYGSSTTGVGSGTDSSRLQDPVFSNRNMHPSNQPGTSSTGHQGTSALGGAGDGAAGLEAARHGGHSGTHDPTSTTGSHGLSSTTHPTSGTSSGLTGSHPTSGSTGLTGSHPTSGTSGLTGSHPTSGTSGLTGSHHTPGMTGATSTLPDRSAPHANIGGITTDRSFPLGGHAGEGPHAIPTANRLDPHVPDSADDYRRGTHQHPGNPGLGSTGAGLGAGGLAGTDASRHGGQHTGSTRDFDPTGNSTSRTGVPHSSTTTGPSTTSSTGHHLGRDATAGAGAAGLGAAGAHELGSNRGTHGLGSSGTSTGTGPSMTSGGMGPSGGQHYNTLGDGTPSGVSTRDPSHPMSSSTGPSSHIPGTGTTTGPISHGGSHLGRDAALGAGAAGLGGTAAHEAGRHHGTGHTSTTEQPTGATGGHGLPAGQKYNTLGDGTPSGISSSDSAHPQHSSHVPGTSSTRDPTSTTGSSGHHYGRDAGLGAAGLGAAGVGAHEYGTHHPSSGTSGLTGQPGTSTTQHAPVPGSNLPTSTPGTHSSTHPTGTAASRAQDTLGTHPGRSAERDTHTGRDAAGVAGVGGAGTAAAYEAEKHKHGKTHDPAHDHHTTEEKKPGLLDKMLGRDPESQHKKEIKQHEKELDKQHKQEEKMHDKEMKQLEKEESKHEKEHEKDMKKLEKDHGTSHKGEAALAGAGAGGAGLAGAEAYRHGDHPSSSTTHDPTRGSVPGTGTHGQDQFQSPSTGRTYDTADGRVPTTGMTGPTAGNAAQRHGFDAPMSGTTGTSGYGGTDRTPLSGHGPTGTSHTGRDAGLAGAGATGVGGAAYGAERAAHPTSGTSSGYPTSGTSSGVPTSGTSSGGHRIGGTDGTPLPSSGTGSKIDPRVDNPSYGGSGHGHGHNTTSPTDSAYAGSPTTADDSPHSGEKPGLMQRLLHRDDPNKLSKDAGTSHHGTTSGTSGNNGTGL